MNEHNDARTFLKVLKYILINMKAENDSFYLNDFSMFGLNSLCIVKEWSLSKL